MQAASLRAQLDVARETISKQQSEIEKLSTELQAAYANVTAARAAAAQMDAQRLAAVKSVSAALARLRDAEMRAADETERLQAELKAARGES